MSPLPHTLHTKRLDLRWLSPAELRELAANGVLTGLSNPCELLTAKEADLAEFFAKRIEQNLAHETWTIRAIIDRTQQTIVGHAGFHLAPDSENLVEVGYSVGELFRQQGIAKEAVRGLLDAAKASGEVEVVRGCTALTNEISKRVLLSLGFHYSAVVEDEEDGPEEVYLLDLKTSA